MTFARFIPTGFNRVTDVTLAHDQADLRRAYLGGGLDAVVSGLVWLTAAVTATVAGTATGYAALFFGGFLIFPLGTLVEKLLFNRGGVRAGNPGGMLVIETLPAMIGVLVRYGLERYRGSLLYRGLESIPEARDPNDDPAP